MDVRMPDGVLVRNVPEGTTQEELLSMYSASKGGQPAAPEAPTGQYGKMLEALRNPQIGSGRRGVVGPAMVGGAGELIKGAGALTQMAFPDAGSRMVETGKAMTEGAKSVSPVSATVGQVGSYLAPFSAAQKVGSAVANTPQVARAIGGIPSFVRSTVGQGTIGGSLGYGLTPDEDNRESAALWGAGGGALTPTIGSTIGKLAEMVRGKINPGAQKGVAEAIDAGYKIPPGQVNNSIIGNLLEGASGKASVAQNASVVNQEVTNRLASKALGLPEETFLNKDILKNVRTEAGKAYEAVENTGLIKPGKEFYSKLNDIKKPFEKIVEGFPDQAPSPVIKMVDSLKSEGFDSSAAVANIRQLRDLADEAYTKGPKNLGKAYKEAANAMEDAVESHLAKIGQKDLLDEFKAARKLIAKTYTVEKALNPAGGTVNARAIASQLKNKPLETELKTIGEFGARFPKAAQTTEGMGSTTQISPLDIYASLGLGGVSYLGNQATGGSADPTNTGILMAAALAARPAAREAILSKFGQNALLRNAPGYSAQALSRALVTPGAVAYGASREKE